MERVDNWGHALEGSLFPHLLLFCLFLHREHLWATLPSVL